MLKWRKVSERCIEARHNGARYTVTKCRVGEVDRYMAWGPAPGQPPKMQPYEWQDYVHQPIAGPYKSRHPAMKACAKHAGVDQIAMPADQAPE